MTYALADPNADSQLVDPAHSDLHRDTNAAVHSLDGRLSALEAKVPETAQNIEQARLVAHEWVSRGPLDDAMTDLVLIPLIWNITGRVVVFNAAKATILTAADADVVLDIVVGSSLAGPHRDVPGTQTSILETPLVIPAGQYYSTTIGVGDFVGDHPMNTYLAAFVLACGTDAMPGADLSVQLNRLL